MKGRPVGSQDDPLNVCDFNSQYLGLPECLPSTSHHRLQLPGLSYGTKTGEAVSPLFADQLAIWHQETSPDSSFHHSAKMPKKPNASPPTCTFSREEKSPRRALPPPLQADSGKAPAGGTWMASTSEHSSSTHTHPPTSLSRLKITCPELPAFQVLLAPQPRQEKRKRKRRLQGTDTTT